MKKLFIWLIGMLFLMVTFAYDEPSSDNGCDDPADTRYVIVLCRLAAKA